MAEEQKKKRKEKPARQEWKPHWLVSLLYRIWMVVYSVFKIAVGAVATVLIICLICMLVFVNILGDYLENDIVPEAAALDEAGLDLDDFKLDQPSSMYYVDSNGEIQKLQGIYASMSSDWADYDEIPRDLINAAVAIEDKRFFEHQGVDWITTIKACAGIFFGDDTAGGSTITQQLIKNLTQENSVTVQRKVMEIFRATEFEKKYDKETIMEWYLNYIYLGQGCRGVKSAAATYFGKELQLLTTAECASLISITNNPSLFDPYGKEFEYGGQLMTGAERNRTRQENTLWSMKQEGYLTEEEYEEALAQEMVFKCGIADEDHLATCPNEDCGYTGTVSTFKLENSIRWCPVCGTETPIGVDASQSVYSWFVDTVYEEVAKAMVERDGLEWNTENRERYMDLISRGGYHIYTTLDMDVQNQVDAIYEDLSQIPAVRNGQQLQSAIVVIDNKTGDIVAMSGGVGEKVDFDAFNRATDATLQTGSSVKPLSAYGPAFEVGAISPATVIKDLPLTYDGGAYPLNDDRRYSYSRTIYSALEDSVNAVAANVVDMVGTGYCFDFAKEKFGLKGLTSSYIRYDGFEMNDINIAALALGAQTWGVTVRDMAAAFATYANDGVYRDARTFTKVYDSEGNLVLDNTQESREILSHKTVTYMNYCLSNAVLSGTGYASYFDYGSGYYGMKVAGKTGTTGDNKDRWFCGYTSYYTAAVWCGFDMPEVIRLSGDTSNPASRLWRKVMKPLHEGLVAEPLYSTSGMRSVTVCLDSGKLATDACKSDVRGISRVETVLVYPEDAPTESCDKHVMVEYCVDGNGVATEYCKHFAEVGQTTLEEKALVKLDQEEIDEIKAAKRYNLYPDFLRDDYVYLINGNGSDGSWKGFDGDINKGVTAPYQVCTVHTKESWEQYQNSHQPTEPEEDDPIFPSIPGWMLP